MTTSFSVGQKVVYRPSHVLDTEPGEEGVVTRITDLFVFVRFGNDVGSKAVYSSQLTPITIGETNGD